MDKLCIEPSPILKGTLAISGAKNAALPLMVLPLLTDQPCVLRNVPKLMDITSMMTILDSLGTDCSFENGVMTLQTASVKKTHAPYEDVRKMRASVVVLGPLLARCGKARVALPGGCAIGVRPIDQHLKAFEKMGAHIEIQDGDVVATLDRVKACEVVFDQVTVTGTINALMAASRGEEPVVLQNCAIEPEVTQVVQTLQKMGATISGIGTSTLRITGNPSLQGFDIEVIPDRIETGTYLVAAAMAQSDVTLIHTHAPHLEIVLEYLQQAGAKINAEENQIHITSSGELSPLELTTKEYPGFPTDMQAQFVTMLTQAQGISLVTETIFENRFMHVPELVRMGANIKIKGSRVKITGKAQLKGAPVMATDLRASASLVLAGLKAQGQTVVNRIYHLDRGYEAIEKKLAQLGAKVWREK